MTNGVYYVDKRSGTSADTLLAVGFAELLRSLTGHHDVEICDQGAYYKLQAQYSIAEPPDTDDPLNLIQPIATKSQVVDDGFPYDQQREKRESYTKKLRELPPKLRSAEAILRQAPELEALLDCAPLSELPLYLVINQMKVAGSFNEPILQWRGLAPTTKQNILTLLLQLFGTHPNPYDQTLAQWELLAKQHNLKRTMTMLQVINPTTGKGANRPKADKLDIGGQEEWWVLEWVKFIGFFRLADPQIIRDSKDRKTYVIKPREISFDALTAIVKTVRQIVWSGTPAKMDILATLRLTQVLVQHDKQALGTVASSVRRRQRPADRIHGCEVTFYKDMGSAFAVMNVAALNVPEWIPALASRDQAERVELLLKEHIQVIQSIQARDGSERSEEYELLARYRDFLSSRTVEPLLDFCALFAPYVSRKIERGEYYQRFSQEMLTEVLSMNQKLTPIISSQGFQNIASAIRQSTVSLQFAKGRKEPVNFEIRYGLTQDLVRHANHADDFMAALTEFIAKYNAESAQKYETSKGSLKRARITQDDLNEIVELLDKGYTPKVLARMLVAYGTAKKDRDKGDPKKDSSPSEDGLSDSQND